MFVSKLIIKINIEQVGLYCRLKFKYHPKAQKIMALEINIKFNSYEGLLISLKNMISEYYSIQKLTVIYRGFQGEQLEKYRREICGYTLDIILPKCRLLTSLQLWNTSNNIVDILLKYSLKFLKRLRLYNNELSYNSLLSLMSINYRYLNELYLIKNNLTIKSLQLLKKHTWPSLITMRIQQKIFNQKYVPLFTSYIFGTLKKIEYICEYGLEQKMKFTIKQNSYCEMKSLNKYRQKDAYFLGQSDLPDKKQQDEGLVDEQTSINK